MYSYYVLSKSRCNSREFIQSHFKRNLDDHLIWNCSTVKFDFSDFNISKKNKVVRGRSSNNVKFLVYLKTSIYLNRPFTILDVVQFDRIFSVSFVSLLILKRCKYRHVQTESIYLIGTTIIFDSEFYRNSSWFQTDGLRWNLNMFGLMFETFH